VRLTCAEWLVSVLLCIACGGRTGVESERSLAPSQEAGGAGGGGAQRAVSWDQIIWDDSLNESVVYLWTGSVTNTWAVVSASAGGVGSFARDHWDGLRWSRTLNERDQSERFNAEQIWAADDQQAIAGSKQNLQRWPLAPWIDWQNTPGCRVIGGSATDDIWCATESELWRFDGANWTHQPMSGIRGILARARNDVWVWGTSGASHFDGLRWSLERADLVSAVSASEGTEVWALQDGDLLHSAGPGSGWTRQNPTGGSISGLWSQSKTNTWIVAAGAAMRWNGSTWQLVPLPNQDERLLISGSSEDIWIAGTLKLIHGRPTPG
jgi:hypothetical protein